MKIVELTSKVQIPLTNEESDILGRFENNNKISKKDFNPREQYLANNLVTKDILMRHKKDGDIYYRKKI